MRYKFAKTLKSHKKDLQVFNFIQKLLHLLLIATFGFILILLFSANPLIGLGVAIGAALIFCKVKLGANTYNFFSKSSLGATSITPMPLEADVQTKSKKSAYEIVLENSKDLEGRLAKIGATGKGLHEKTSSVSALLAPDLLKELRAVATIRNKLIHEEGFMLTRSELDDFEDLAYSACRKLRNLPALPKIATHQFSCAKCKKTDIAHITMKQGTPLFAHCQHCGEQLDLESEGFNIEHTAV